MRSLIGLLFLVVVVWDASAYPRLRRPLVKKSTVICPDKTSECAAHKTCCEMVDKSYSCCPLDQAVCCPQGVLCCPHNHTCNGTVCVEPPGKPVPAKPTTTSDPIITSPQTTSCPDNTYCDNGTCCLQRSGKYGCCNFERAVCCADKVHCCPEEFDCDIDTNTCISKDRIHSLVRMVKARGHYSSDFTVGSVTCSNGNTTTTCPDNNICCKTGESFDPFMCCPFPSGVCCGDKKHCCPSGFECVINNTTSTYTCKPSDQLPMKLPLYNIS